MRPYLESFADTSEAVSDVQDDEALKGDLLEEVSKEARTSRNVKRLWPLWTALISVAVATSLLFLMVKCFHASGVTSDREPPAVIDDGQKGRRLSANAPFYCDPGNHSNPGFPGWGAATYTELEYANNNAGPSPADGPATTSEEESSGSPGSGEKEEAPATAPTPPPSPGPSGPPRKKLKKSLAVRRGAQLKIEIPSPKPPKEPQAAPQPPAVDPPIDPLYEQKMEKLVTTKILVKQSRDNLRMHRHYILQFGEDVYAEWMLQDGPDDVFD